MDKIKKLENQNIDILPLERSDIDELVKNFSFSWVGPEKTLAKWNAYYAEHEAGERHVCLVKKDKHIVGYGSLLAESAYKPFEQADVFEIADVWIAKSERQQGLATLLITYFESIAQDEEATHIGMGVPLYASYAAAQCLCVRVGYLPDGEGMTYQGIPVVPGKQYPIDDDLRLWFIKDLSAEQDEE